MGEGNKTEKPTAKKLKDARKKGQVSQSKDLSGGVVFVAGFMMVSMVLPGFADKMRQFMSFCFTRGFHAPVDPGVQAIEVLSKGGSLILNICMPVFGAMFLAALATGYMQAGSIFTFDPLKPDLKKLNPVEGFKKLFFQASTYVELAKSVLKMVVVSALVYFIVVDNFRYIVLSARRPLTETSMLVGTLMFKLFVQVSFFFLVVAAADFFFQKKQFEKKMMMTKEEIKQEHKSAEGDPHTKHQRKRMHQEIMMHNMVEDVKKANVVVVNPKHIAVAIRYDKENMNAPQVSAKGQDLWALQIIEVAKQFGVPIMRNVPLAHSLNEMEIGDEIPESLYEAVAEVLNWVYKMANK